MWYECYSNTLPDGIRPVTLEAFKNAKKFECIVHAILCRFTSDLMITSHFQTNLTKKPGTHPRLDHTKLDYF